MTRQETVQIMAVLQAAFPSWARGMSDDEGRAVLNLWAMMFQDDAAADVMAAVQALIATQKEGYPPTIGAVKEKLDAMRMGDRMTEGEAWQLVYRAICKSSHESEREFKKLPPELQRLVGSPNQLRDWSQMEADTVNSVVASNFQRAYKARAVSDRESRMLPQSVKTAIGGITARWALPEEVSGNGD